MGDMVEISEGGGGEMRWGGMSAPCVTCVTPPSPGVSRRVFLLRPRPVTRASGCHRTWLVTQYCDHAIAVGDACTYFRMSPPATPGRLVMRGRVDVSSACPTTPTLGACSPVVRSRVTRPSRGGYTENPLIVNLRDGRRERQRVARAGGGGGIGRGLEGGLPG